MASCVNRMWDRDRPKGERCKAVPWRGIECGIEIDRRMNGCKECGIEIDRRVNSAEVETKLILEVEQQLHVDVGRDRFHVNFGASFSLAPSCTARLYMLKALGWLRLDPEYSNDAQDSSVAVWLLAATSTLRRDRTNLVFEFGIQRTSSRLAHRAKIASPGQKLGSRRRNLCCMTVENTWMWELVRAATTSWSCWTQTSVPVWESKVILEVEQQLHVVVGCDWLDGVEALGRCFGIAVKLRRSETVHVWSESEIVFCSNWLQIESSVVFLTRADPLDNFCCNCLAMELWDVFCYSCGYVADNSSGFIGVQYRLNWTKGKIGILALVCGVQGGCWARAGVGALGLARRVTDMMIERKRWALVSLQYKTQLGIDKGS
ncbi:hypothetical protein C8F04DRAFT_1183831 [Mycena alexandri]|uniref:Uncharacterized protein n=1 Tax=Mycena alexandri TaxID=1745969 RepID=A0AAD6X3U5_9AGAR|nr:hypothetical protein C8F04DRAFT_1183831 [Mycena alexandri]